MRLLAVLALLLSGCSVLVDQGPCGSIPGTRVECFADGCPAEEQVQDIADHLSELEPQFDPTLPVLVQWVSSGEFVGITKSECRVQATTLGVIPHELFHVLYWRLTGDGDANHSEPGGPWNPETDEVARQVRVDLGI